MTDHPEFTVEVFQNEYLTVGATDVNAIVTVTSSGSTAPGVGDAAEVIVVDTSGSMGQPPTKLSAAKQATIAAIDTLRNGVEFAVVAGNHAARPVYPPGGLAVAGSKTRSQAASAVRRLGHGGGTAVGSWLLMADSLFRETEAKIKHVILLTDGRNESEEPEELEAALRTVSGRFVGDCRGVGTDWEVPELRRVADALLGTVDIVAEPAGLEADFRAMAGAAMSKTIGEVSLRLWTPEGSSVVFVKQVEPTLTDLTARRVEVPPRSGDYPTGAWGAESRDFHVCVRVPSASVGDRMLAARVGLVGSDEAVLGTGKVLAVWTDDMALSTRINREVAHYTGQADLAAAIQEGLEARRAGDVHTATAKLGRAVELATKSGNSDTVELLAGVVEIDDPHTGTVHLKRNVAAVDEMTLDTRSSKTLRVKKQGGS
ncbi:VWA domain-containing protein [Tsukamurella sp. 8F]|uniref:vWA domain-containing protein n=1 Tax=unclassified Tsukamurella TaxID=2633480 RepID=UPI0023BA3463|nr:MULTISPECIES: VWA domain-containing protein [unclassified Tsukamurella]MDF0529807.1 VWA domain-containing protein [Tsukamurella sp. 8J]MDF0586999.1 VWA domain-containing protein [Tsukamurella sp. 8F]